MLSQKKTMHKFLLAKYIPIITFCKRLYPSSLVVLKVVYIIINKILCVLNSIWYLCKAIYIFSLAPVATNVNRNLKVIGIT